MFLIAGLGNPGERYARTRHNAGFIFLDRLAKHRLSEASWKQDNKLQSAVTGGRLGTEKVLLVKPLTFMNLSGRAVRAAMDFYKIPADRVVVVYDDVDLPLGKIRLRQGGGSGGHNGVKSLQQHVGDDFLRIRIGVGQPDWFADGKFDKGYAEAGDYVLAAFAAHEREPLMAACDRAESALDCLLTQDLTAAMNAYNG